jgi:hypothetical protein
VDLIYIVRVDFSFCNNRMLKKDLTNMIETTFGQWAKYLINSFFLHGGGRRCEGKRSHVLRLLTLAQCGF